MLIQIEWGGQDVLPVTILPFGNFISVYEPTIKSWFDVAATQMFIFILFISAGVSFQSDFAGVSFQSDFSMRVSLSIHLNTWKEGNKSWKWTLEKKCTSL